MKRAITLHGAVAKGYVPTVIRLLREVSVNSKNHNGQTPLHIAVKYNHVNLVKLLLNSRADASICDNLGKTPFEIACAKGYAKIVEIFMIKGVKIEGDRINLLYSSIEKNYVILIEKLIGGKEIDLDVPYQLDLTPLQFAVKSEKIAVVKTLLSKGGANVNGRNSGGQTALHIAIGHNLDTIADLLLTHGADINAKDANRVTPLHCASSNNHFILVDWLISKGAGLNAQDTKCLSPLHFAVKCNSYVAVNSLLESGADPNMGDSSGRTPLHLVAAKEPVLFLVNQLLRAGANINARDLKGRTPLHVAVINKHFTMIAKLLEEGADVEAKDFSGQSTVHFAIIDAQDKVLGLLLDHGATVHSTNKKGLTPLHFAIQRCPKQVEKKFRFWRTFELLLQAEQPKVNYQDKEGNTSLHFCSKKSCILLIQILCEKGALINLQNQEGQTALHFAAVALEWSVFNHLLKVGGDPFTKDKNNLTPLEILLQRFHEVKAQTMSNKVLLNMRKDQSTVLHLAVSHGLLNIVGLFLDQGADPEIVDGQGLTALLNAVETGYVRIIELLMARGANINTSSPTGKTVLHLAIIKNHKAIVQELLTRSIEVNAKDCQGKTAFHYTLAESDVCCPTIKMMLDAGAGVDDVDIFGRTPLDYILANKPGSIQLTVLVQHIIKLKTLNTNVNVDVSSFEQFDSFRACCLEEIKHLKEEKVGSDLLLDVFDKYGLPWYVHNRVLEERVQCGQLAYQYPMYNSLLKQTFERAKKRLENMKRAQLIFSTFPLGSGLPVEVRLRVLSYLRDVDLHSILKIVSSTLV